MGHRGNGFGPNQRERRQDQRYERRADRQEQYERQRRHCTQHEPDSIPQIARPAVEPATPNQIKYVTAIRRNDVTIADGPAGCGKTYLGMGEAVHSVLERKNGPIKKILLVRPAIAADEDLGFLPGTDQAKLAPYMRPLQQALQKFTKGEEEFRYLLNPRNNLIEMIALGFLRGTTFDNHYMILDEAQNTTEGQMLLFLTRIGKDSKIVVNGDSSQCDLDHDIPNGLDRAIQRIGARGPNFQNGNVSAVRLDKSDIMRHPLIGELIDAWEEEPTVQRNGHNGHARGLSDGDPKRFVI